MNQVISCHLRVIYVSIFQQTACILNSLHPTVNCGHGIRYCCRSTFLELGVYCLTRVSFYEWSPHNLEKVELLNVIQSKKKPILLLHVNNSNHDIRR